MERLTKPLCGGYELPMIPMEIKTQDDLQKFHEARKFYESCAIRCGQYEDTGLEPEEIKNALDVNDIIPEINVTVDHLRDILQAEQDGRLVVLPCKVGDTVFRVFTVGTREPLIKEVVIKTAGEAADLIGRIGKKNMLVSVFRTREEAEAALKGEPYGSVR